MFFTEWSLLDWMDREGLSGEKKFELRFECRRDSFSCSMKWARVLNEGVANIVSEGDFGAGGRQEVTIAGAVSRGESCMAWQMPSHMEPCLAVRGQRENHWNVLCSEINGIWFILQKWLWLLYRWWIVETGVEVGVLIRRPVEATHHSG